MQRQRKSGQKSRQNKASGGFGPKGPSYRGQQSTVLVLEGTPSLLTKTAGTIAASIPMDISRITGFAARFGSTFDEYRILAARVRITPVKDSQGISKMWFDEKSTAAPTANESQERTSLAVVNSNHFSKSLKIMSWRAKDLLDLEYTPIATTVTPSSFKVYTSTALWASENDGTSVWIVEPEFVVEFRGIAST